MNPNNKKLSLMLRSVRVTQKGFELSSYIQSTIIINAIMERKNQNNIMKISRQSAKISAKPKIKISQHSNKIQNPFTNNKIIYYKIN